MLKEKRQLWLLIISVLLNCTIISQTLQPKIQLIESDTCFCFNIEQAKYIAGQIEGLKYCDSSIVILQDEVLLYDGLLHVKDAEIDALHGIVKNDKKVNQLNQLIKTELQTEVDALNKEVKRQKIQKYIIGAAGVLTNIYLGYLLVIKK